MQQEQSNQFTAAIDIEAASPTDIVAIGIACSDGTKVRICRKVQWPTIDEKGCVVEYGDFEKRCWNQYWSTQPKEVIEACKTNPLSHKAFAEEFKKIVSGWPDDAVIVSDNPSFDISACDWLVYPRHPIRYSSEDGVTGEYRDIIDVDSAGWMIPPDMLPKWKFTHVPEEDADMHLAKYFFLKELKESMTQLVSSVQINEWTMLKTSFAVLRKIDCTEYKVVKSTSLVI